MMCIKLWEYILLAANVKFVLPIDYFNLFSFTKHEDGSPGPIGMYNFINDTSIIYCKRIMTARAEIYYWL